MAHNALPVILNPEARLLGEKISDRQRARTLPQDFAALIIKASRLTQRLLLLRWRGGGVKRPHDMRLADSRRHQLPAIAVKFTDEAVSAQAVPTVPEP